MLKVVLQPEDPLRAQYIAENYLENAKLVSKTRGIFIIQGFIKVKEITVGQVEWVFQVSESILLNCSQSMM